MALVSDHIEPDTRERILVVAERLFREIGYQKTTVADIAKVLRMSPANVYRFFDSKKAIHEGVARALMGEVEVEAQRIADGPGPAAPSGVVLLHRHDPVLPSADDRPMRHQAGADHRPDDRFPLRRDGAAGQVTPFCRVGKGAACAVPTILALRNWWARQRARIRATADFAHPTASKEK
jgi:AcrR family transcriptional regulator